MPGRVHADPALVGVPTLYTNYGDSPATAGLTNPGGADLVLIVRVLLGTPSSGSIATNEVAGMSYGGQSLVQYNSVIVGTSNGNADLETWYLVAPVGNQTLSVNWSTPNLYFNVFFSAEFFDNASQTLPIVNSDLNPEFSSVTTYTATMTTIGADDTMSSFLVAGADNGATTVTTSGTEEYFDTNADPSDVYASYVAATAPGPYTITYSMGSNSNPDWVSDNIEIAAFAPPTPTFTASPTSTSSASPTETATETPTLMPTFTVTSTPTPAPPTPTPGPPTPTPVPPATLSLTAAYPNPDPSHGALWLPYVLTCDATVNITIYDVAGETVRDLTPFAGQTGPNEEEWDGRNGSGVLVSSGIYIGHIVAQAFGQKQDAWIKMAITR